MIAIQMASKRLIDVGLSVVGLILSIPLAVIIIIFILVLLGPPVIFVQERAGLHGRPFRLYKFRSMTELASPSGTLAEEEARLGRYGRLLRRTSLDELPQLWNVLKGDMSLVGPRPLLLEYVPIYTEDQRRRLSVKPGLTGWAQICGRNELSWQQKFELDQWYIDHWTLALDLRIIVMTVLRIVSGEGLSRAGHVTTPRFTGAGDPPTIPDESNR